MEAIANIITTDNLAELRADIAEVAKCRSFELPDADVHVIGISGGVDSSCVALIMAALFPHLENVFYIFTDTGVEAPGTIEQIDKIELMIGRKVLRLSAGMDLFSLIESQGNYLPSQRQRFCTRISKIQPMVAFFETLKAKFGKNAKIASYVGIRADEPTREGGQYGDGGTVSYMPMQPLGFTRADVYKLVDKWIGIPSFYAGKSRSGCQICIFSRRSEVLSQLEHYSENVDRAIKMEGLSDEATAKLKSAPPSVVDQVGVARNHLVYAVPTSILTGQGPQSNSIMPWETFRASMDTSSNEDLFGGGSRNAKRYFVAVALHVGWMGFTSGYECYHQNYITHSTSLGGLKTALKFYWEHKLGTVELVGAKDEDELRDTLKVGIYEIALDDADEHLAINQDGVYTWQNDRQPLLLLRKTKHMLEQVLLTEGLHQGLKHASGAVRRESKAYLDKITRTYGQLLWSQCYEPPLAEDLVDDIDIEDAPVACNACSR